MNEEETLIWSVHFLFLFQTKPFFKTYFMFDFPLSISYYFFLFNTHTYTRFYYCPWSTIQTIQQKKVSLQYEWGLWYLKICHMEITFLEKNMKLGSLYKCKNRVRLLWRKKRMVMFLIIYLFVSRLFFSQLCWLLNTETQEKSVDFSLIYTGSL